MQTFYSLFFHGVFRPGWQQRGQGGGFRFQALGAQAQQVVAGGGIAVEVGGGYRRPNKKFTPINQFVEFENRLNTRSKLIKWHFEQRQQIEIYP